MSEEPILLSSVIVVASREVSGVRFWYRGCDRSSPLDIGSSLLDAMGFSCEVTVKL